eukprot:TRINITY_DN20311_c0_g1_i1.p1 TRINITY_DN20311_c0_g1~~TRINITY_DN20311_c0_g1_i1.p1  ORF type:complete len:458 (+),score=49.82 TRINITY_DN20311_c0_g1_i1:96-1469(+)
MGCKLSLDKVPKMVPIEETKFLIRKKDQTDKQYTVILDLDGTAGAWWKKEVRNGSNERSYMLFDSRPGLAHFLEEVSKIAELVLWASCTMDQARYAFATVDPNRHIHHIVYRDCRWTGSARDKTKKQLSLLGRNMDHVLALDDNPCEVSDFLNTVIVKKWDRRNTEDVQLMQTLSIIKELVASKRKTPEFMMGCKTLRTVRRKPHNYKTLVAAFTTDGSSIDSVNGFRKTLVKEKFEPLGFILRKDKTTHRLYIKSIRPETPAARCGFAAFVDCRILAVEGVADPQLADLTAEADGKETMEFFLKVNLHEAPKNVLTDPSLREKVECNRDSLGIEFRDLKKRVYIWGIERNSPLNSKPHLVGCVVVFVDGKTFSNTAELEYYIKAKKGPSTTVLEVSNRALGGSSLADDSTFTLTTDLSSSLTTTIASSSAFHDEFVDEGSHPITHLYQISRIPNES